MYRPNSWALWGIMFSDNDHDLSTMQEVSQALQAEADQKEAEEGGPNSGGGTNTMTYTSPGLGSVVVL